MLLAEMANPMHNYVGEEERGEKLASLETVVRVAKAFKLRAHELLAKANL